MPGSVLSSDFCPTPLSSLCPRLWSSRRADMGGAEWGALATLYDCSAELFQGLRLPVLSVILLWHCQACRMHFAGEQRHWMELEAQWLIHFIHYLGWGGIQDFAQRGLKGLQQAPSVCAANLARITSSWFEREVTKFHLFLRSSTLQLSVSSTTRVRYSFSLLLQGFTFSIKEK